MKFRFLSLCLALLLLTLSVPSEGGIFSFKKKLPALTSEPEPEVAEEVIDEVVDETVDEVVEEAEPFVPPEGAVRTEDFINLYEGEGQEWLEEDGGQEGVQDGVNEDEYDWYGPGEEELSIEEEEPAFNLEEVLLGASTDQALLVLARRYAGKKDFKKAALAYQRIIEDFPGSKVKYDAFFELGYLRYREGRLRDSRLLLKYILSSWRAPRASKDKARALVEEIDSIYKRGRAGGDRISIGALLPLQGVYSRLGEAALKGVLLAADIFSGGDIPVEVYVRDAGPEPEQVKAAIDELVNAKRVRALVGPLLSSSAYEAAVSAQNRHVPMVTLSQRQGVTEAGDYIFRVSLMPRDQASLLAAYAYNDLGKRTFSVLYPRNNYGTTLARYFADEVKALGGEVVSSASYPPGAKDFTGELTRIFGIEETETSEGRRTIREYTPTIEVDALYIPEFYPAVSMIVPYLEYLSIKDVQLLGSNGWNSNKLTRLAGDAVEGAVFVDGFFSGSKRDATVDFRSRFLRVFGEEPSVVESQSYDATMALLSALESKEFKWMDREAVKEAMASSEPLPGSTGPIYFDKTGEAVKEFYLLSVTGGRIIELTGDSLTIGGVPGGPAED